MLSQPVEQAQGARLFPHYHQLGSPRLCHTHMATQPPFPHRGGICSAPVLGPACPSSLCPALCLLQSWKCPRLALCCEDHIEWVGGSMSAKSASPNLLPQLCTHPAWPLCYPGSTLSSSSGRDQMQRCTPRLVKKHSSHLLQQTAGLE